MITTTDEQILKEKGITLARIVEQLESFKKGFPFLKIECAAGPGKGILLVQEDEIPFILKQWDEYLLTDATIFKFVPASAQQAGCLKICLNSLKKQRMNHSIRLSKNFSVTSINLLFTMI